MQAELSGVFTDVGSGPVVVLLHGNPDNRSAWDEVIAGLGPTVRAIAPDLPGFGEAPEPPAAFDFSAGSYAAFVDDVLDGAGIDSDEPVVIVVHDIGAVAGLAWVIGNPSRVRGVVITNTVVHADYTWHAMARLWRTPVVGRLVLGMMTRPAFRASFEPGEISDAQFAAMWDKIDGATKSTICRLYRRMTRREYFEGFAQRLAEILRETNSAVLWGEKDPYIDVSYANRFGVGRVVRLPDCGHWVPQTRPDAIVDAVLDIVGGQARSAIAAS